MHWYNFDDCEDTEFDPDGGIVEVTTDGGATWSQIYPTDGYPHVLDDTCGNPLAFRDAYAHDGGAGSAFIPAVFDLTPYSGGVVSIRFHAGWDCGNCATNEGWYIDDVMISAEGVPWLSASPTSGTIPPGSYQVVDVMFAAGPDVFGGDYAADVVVSGNDPSLPEAPVLAELHVTGAPNITVSDSEIDYGSLFVGLTAVETLVVANDGTDLLSVSGVSTNNPDYTVDGAPFSLSAGETRDLLVTFAPPSAGLSTGELTITSDDPGEPTVVVQLTGSGVDPPVMAVSPESLHSDLFTGGTASHAVTIENNGGSNLTWNAFMAVSASATQNYTLTAPQPGGEDADGVVVGSEGTRTEPITASLEDLTGVNIMYDRSHGQTFSSGWSTIIADLQARGATVVENTLFITSELLGDYDVVWTTDISVPWNVVELSALEAWILNGGGFVFEGDNTATVPIYNALLTAVGAGIVYSDTDGVSGTTANIYPHETTTDVANIYLSANIGHLSTVISPAERLVDDVVGVANSAYSQVGGGRIVAMADEIFLNSRMGLDDNQLFANQVFDWVAGTVDWLSFSPTEGVIEPGQSEDLTVDFDATGLEGGDFDANVVIAGNDPFNAEVSVSAHMHVVGAPDIALSDTTLDFGLQFVGDTDTRTLTVSNEGTDLLVVTSITSDHGDYTADPTRLRSGRRR
jgi:hypothetical protein